MAEGGKDAAVARVAAGRYWRAADARIVVDAWRTSGEGLGAFSERCVFAFRTKLRVTWPHSPIIVVLTDPLEVIEARGKRLALVTEVGMRRIIFAHGLALLVVAAGCSDPQTPMQPEPQFTVGEGDDCPSCRQPTEGERDALQRTINDIGLGPQPECSAMKQTLQYLLDTGQIAINTTFDNAWAWAFRVPQNYPYPQIGLYRARFWYGTLWDPGNLWATAKHEGWHLAEDDYTEDYAPAMEHQEACSYF